MTHVATWLMFFLGIAHIVFGLFRFKGPVADAVSDGFIGKFAVPEVRRTAFRFLIFGPMLMLAGHVGIHAAAKGDLALLRILGIYALVIAIVGSAAFPKSPFWAPLLVAPVLIAAGFGLLL